MKQQDTIEAVIVRLSIKSFKNSRVDPLITEAVCAEKDIGEEGGKWLKTKFPRESLQPITKHASDCRNNWHYIRTLPWEAGYRLLTLPALDAYMKEFEARRQQYFALVDEFVRSLPAHVQAARQMLGKNFESFDYPTRQAMRGYFEFRIEHSPIPKAEAFQLRGIAAHAVKAMQAELENRMKENVQAAMSDAWQRLIAPLQAMTEKLKEDEPLFRDTLVTNISDVVNLIPELNLTGSPQLFQAASAIREGLSGITAESLRESVEVRTKAHETAKALIAQFGQFGQFGQRKLSQEKK